MKRLLWGPALLLALLVVACQGPTSSSDGGESLKGLQYSLPYSPYDYEVLKSQFTTESMAMDGKLDEAAWGQAESSVIDNIKSATAAEDATSGATGVIRSVWDGYRLYVAVQVSDNTPANNPTLEASTERATGLWNGYNASWLQDDSWISFDGVQFSMDFWNDKVDKWEDDDALFAISRSGKLAYQDNSDRGTYGSAHACPDAREYTNRLNSWAVTSTATGYIIELAIDIYGANLANGANFGLDAMIGDSPSDDAVRTSRTYWSHSDNSYRFDSRDGNQDWGAVMLEGHVSDEQSDFANSDWMLTNAIRWVDANIPTTMESSWTATSWTALQNALTAGRALLTTESNTRVDFGIVTQAEVLTRAQAIEAAISSLRWANDPIDATELDSEAVNTLPDPLRFKTGAKKGTLATTSDWTERADEIRTLASIYEYGPKPDAPTTHSATVQYVPPVPAHYEKSLWTGVVSSVEATPERWSIVAPIAYNGTEGSTPAGATATAGSVTNTYELFLPYESLLNQTLTQRGPLPVLVSYDVYTATYSDNEVYTDKGVAVLSVSDTSTDDRSHPWTSPRAGTFRSFYPYNGRGGLNEISNTMGGAWGVSRAIDALEDAGDVALTRSTLTFSITNGGTGYGIGDRVSADGTTWYMIGDIAGSPTATSGAITMLYLGAGATPPSASGSVTFTMHQKNSWYGWQSSTEGSGAVADVTLGTEAPIGMTLREVVDPEKIATVGFSWCGKYAFVAAVYDDRIKVAIPGAAGATGPQTYRYNPAGNVYSWGRANGGETMGDTIMHNPGRTTEVFRRFLTHFRFYYKLKGIDANGDLSHGYGQRLPYDHHELVASLFPRAVIERNTINDYADGSEGDAIGMQAARIVYRKLIADGLTAQAHGSNVVANDLVKFNYRGVQTGEPHGTDPEQREREADYVVWYFYGTPAYSTILDVDPFYNDVLVAGGSNSYERHYGGFRTMMPWTWAEPYYPD